MLGGATVTTFEVRESDVSIIASLAISASITSATSCSNAKANLTTVQSYAICVLDGKISPFMRGIGPFCDSSQLPTAVADASFASLYPEAFATESSTSGSATTNTGSSASTTTGSSKSSSTSSKADANGSSATSSQNTGSQSSTTKSSSSHSYTVWIVIVVVVVVIGVLLAWFIRRRRDRKAQATKNGDLSRSLNDQSEQNHTGTGTVASHSNISSNKSEGYLSNDVRNDEALIPHRLPLNEITITKELAAGGFGIVYLATFSGRLVVVKQIGPGKAQSTEELCQFMDEIRLCARLDHPKIVKFIGLSWTNLFDLSLILEYMANGDLHTLLRKQRKQDNNRQVFTWFKNSAEIRSKVGFALDIAEALVYLHSFDPPVIHRDLKSKNVLLGADYGAKLSDFGVSRASAPEGNSMTGGMGTTAWISPEVLQGSHYSEKADIYSMGIVLSELDTCGHPYNSNRDSSTAFTDAKIALLVSTASILPTTEPDCPPEVRDLILHCVAHDPADRPTAVELHYRLLQIRSNYNSGLTSAAGRLV